MVRQLLLLLPLALSARGGTLLRASSLSAGRSDVAPGETTKQKCGRLEALEGKFRVQLADWEKEWVAVSQKYETMVCEGLGCEPVEHKRQQNVIEYRQVKERMVGEKDELIKMLVMIEKAIKTPPMNRCSNFEARLAEEAELAHGRKVLTEGKTGGGGGKEDAPVGASMEMEPPKTPLAKEPFPAKELEEFGPDPTVKVDIPEPPVPAEPFDCDCYNDRYPDLQTALKGDCKALKNHYLNHGIKENRDPSCEGGPFNADCYFDRYPDLQTALGSDPTKLKDHWKKHGVGEKRISGCDGYKAR